MGTWLSPEDFAARFAEIHPPFASQAAAIEANRCLNCFDAPCMGACPTHIDVPRFIKKIATGNVRGSALTILDSNILGLSCSRVCPVEVLCEGACVMHQQHREPIEIGRLQRHAMDWFYAHSPSLPVAAKETGKRVACIGAGPASLACAAELRRLGIAVTVFDRRSLAGGLNTYGIAEYKLRPADSLKEVELVRSMGVEFRLGVEVSADIEKLEQEFDAIFLGLGLGASHKLGVPGEEVPGVIDALSFIARYKTDKPQIGQCVVVVGAGNTAIDAATAARRLGAKEVFIVYRRGEAEMPAFAYEYELAKRDRIQFCWWTEVKKIHGTDLEVHGTDTVAGVECLTKDGEVFHIGCDLVVLAIGQGRLVEVLENCRGVELEKGHVKVNRATGQTSNPKYFAGGDCVNGGREVVDAVADEGSARESGSRSGCGFDMSRADLTTLFAGKIRCPNPFWLASGPPANCGDQVMRAFDAGWGGAVWKTLGEPIVNVSSRYSSVDWNGQRMMGLNNIELITDRPLDVNFREIAEVKKRYPHHAVIASLMVESKREAWHEIVKRAEGAGADGLELNFGCPHGMSERGMGSAVGQVPEYCSLITEWVKEIARTPVLVKLTPNVTDIRPVARAARKGGADALSAINTINSITGVDLDTLTPRPAVDGLSAHGGYCGPAVKPIALHMVQQIASDPEVGLPVSGIGGISSWRDAAEFILLGCQSLQLCTAPMHWGFRIVEDMIDGLKNWMDEKGFSTIEDFRGRSLPRLTEWKHLNLNYKIVARIDPSKCIGCDLCYIACWDGAHQCIHVDGFAKPEDLIAASRGRITTTPIAKLDGLAGRGPAPLRIPKVDEDECVGCNLCWLVCPVEDCIAMECVDQGLPAQTWAQRQSE